MYATNKINKIFFSLLVPVNNISSLATTCTRHAQSNKPLYYTCQENKIIQPILHKYNNYYYITCDIMKQINFLIPFHIILKITTCYLKYQY